MDYISEQVLALAAEAERQRLEAFEYAWKSYEGKAKLPLAIPPNGSNDNVRANYARLIVDTGVSFLFGKPVVLTVDEDDAEENPQESRLADLWRRSGGNTWDKKTAKNGGVTGHVVAKLQPTDDGPRAIVVDPSNFYPEYDDEDFEKLSRAELRWSTIDKSSGKPKPAVRRQRFEPNGDEWLVIDEINRGANQRWQEIGRVRHPFPWAPIFHAQNLPAPNEFWGVADLEPDILGLIFSMERVLGRRNRILRLHAHPKPWGKAIDPTQMKTLDGDSTGAWFFPDSDAEMGLLEMKSDLQSSKDLYRDLKEALHELSRVPEIATGRTEHADRLQGVALEILYQPLIMKTFDKRGTYGPFKEEISARMLEMDGTSVERVVAQWPDLLPVDTQSEAQGYETLQRMQVVSDETIAKHFGLDWGVEKKRLEGQPPKQTVADALMTHFDRGNPQD